MDTTIELNSLKQRTFQTLQLSHVLKYFVGRELPAMLTGEDMVFVMSMMVDGSMLSMPDGAASRLG
jgi:hypothetical protein